jgi:hypothetical protein
MSSTACGNLHEPETLYDDILASEDLSVGQTYTYCINAYSHSIINWAEEESISGSYESSPRCHAFEIQWEARLTGRVRLMDEAGKLPVADTIITWSIGNGALTGDAVTDEDGKFSIYIRTSALTQEYEEIIVTVSKRSSHISHQYECDGQPCTQRRVLMQALDFTRSVEFTDTSTIPFVGNVYVDGTQHDEMQYGCPLAGAQVCLKDHIHHTSLGCSITDSVGYYAIPAAVGLSVYAQVSFNNHTFARLTGESTRSKAGSVSTVDSSGGTVNYDYFVIEENAALQEPTDFVDQTFSTVTLQMAGGKCNRTLGLTTARFTYATCASTWSKDVQFSSWETIVNMPAHSFEVEIVAVSHPTVEIGDMVPKYLTAVRTLKQEADMTSQMAQVRWEFHPQPVIELDIERAGANNCNAIVLAREVETDLTVTVTEKFWGDQTDCTWIEGNVTILNQLGESVKDTADLLGNGAITPSQATLLSKCAEGCNLDLELEEDDSTAISVYHSAQTTIRVMTGEPEIVAEIAGIKYAKPVTISMNTGVYAVTKVVPVVITGHKLISDRFTMDFPEYFPLLIL